MAHKRARSSSPSKSSQITPAESDIYISDPIHDRASTFIGLFSATLPHKTLQAHPAISAASHRITAWRQPSKQRTLTQGAAPRFDLAHDDDGEKGAGVRLARLLEHEGVVGCAVVGRWWGGVMLGPARFTWIENVAREAIFRWSAAAAGAGEAAQQLGAEQGPLSKKAKTGEGAHALVLPQDTRSLETLIEELERRDRNIVVLRDLLREKRDRLEGATSPATSSPVKTMDYATMSLSRLLALDKARDATMTFILRDLDKVDQLQKEEDELNAAFEKVAEADERRKDEEAFAEMAEFDRETEDLAAFEEMERIARDIEVAAESGAPVAASKPDETPRTPDKPSG